MHTPDRKSRLLIIVSRMRRTGCDESHRLPWVIIIQQGLRYDTHVDSCLLGWACWIARYSVFPWVLMYKVISYANCPGSDPQDHGVWLGVSLYRPPGKCPRTSWPPKLFRKSALPWVHCIEQSHYYVRADTCVHIEAFNRFWVFGLIKYYLK